MYLLILHFLYFFCGYGLRAAVAPRAAPCTPRVHKDTVQVVPDCDGNTTSENASDNMRGVIDLDKSCLDSPGREREPYLPHEPISNRKFVAREES